MNAVDEVVSFGCRIQADFATDVVGECEVEAAFAAGFHVDALWQNREGQRAVLVAEAGQVEKRRQGFAFKVEPLAFLGAEQAALAELVGEPSRPCARGEDRGFGAEDFAGGQLDAVDFLCLAGERLPGDFLAFEEQWFQGVPSEVLDLDAIACLPAGGGKGIDVALRDGDRVDGEAVPAQQPGVDGGNTIGERLLVAGAEFHAGRAVAQGALIQELDVAPFRSQTLDSRCVVCGAFFGEQPQVHHAVQADSPRGSAVHSFVRFGGGIGERVRGGRGERVAHHGDALARVALCHALPVDEQHGESGLRFEEIVGSRGAKNPGAYDDDIVFACHISVSLAGRWRCCTSFLGAFQVPGEAV